MKKKTEGRITISKPSGVDIVTLTIDDPRDWSLILKIEMSLEDFARAMFGHASVPCRLDRAVMVKMSKDD